MTNEVAIELLDNLVGMVSDNHDSDYDTALKMAIKALSQEPTVTSTDEPMTMVYPTVVCDDAISRKDVINAIDKWISEYKPQHYLIQSIRDLPSVTHKSGKWIDIEDSNSSKCSECGAETPMYFDPYGHGKGIVVVETSYCPNCGAKMESEDKE